MDSSSTTEEASIMDRMDHITARIRDSISKATSRDTSKEATQVKAHSSSSSMVSNKATAISNKMIRTRRLRRWSKSFCLD